MRVQLLHIQGDLLPIIAEISPSVRFKHFVWQYFLHKPPHLTEGVVGVIALSHTRQKFVILITGIQCFTPTGSFVVSDRQTDKVDHGKVEH